MRTLVQWMKGENGTGGTYTFSPKPMITRSSPGQKTSVLEIPKMNGSIVQTLGLGARKIEVQGVIYVITPSFDNLVEKKRNLEDGLGTGLGQLHIISEFGNANSRHVYYKGILDGEIQWAEQKNMSFLDYRISILCPDPTEYYFGSGNVRTIASDARIA
jgi:hypothetical protein